MEWIPYVAFVPSALLVAILSRWYTLRNLPPRGEVIEKLENRVVDLTAEANEALDKRHQAEQRHQATEQRLQAERVLRRRIAHHWREWAAEIGRQLLEPGKEMDQLLVDSDFSEIKVEPIPPDRWHKGERWGIAIYSLEGKRRCVGWWVTRESAEAALQKWEASGRAHSASPWATQDNRRRDDPSRRDDRIRAQQKQRTQETEQETSDAA